MGGGMAQLVYYCSTQSKIYKVVNGNERGGPLNKINSFLQGNHAKLSALDPNFHVYLENLSGDYYTYDKWAKEWQPKGNFGLHYSRTEAS